MNKIAWIFASLLFSFTVFSYAFVDLNLTYLKSLYTGFYLNNRIELSIIFFLLIGGLFYLYHLITLRIEEYVKLLPKIITVVVAATFFSYPAALTFDIFNYITTAKVTYFYHENPYLIYPIEFLNEPYLQFTRAANKLALYGPVWILITAVPFYLGLGNFLLTLFSFKLVMVIFYLATVYIMSKMDRIAATVFALNPLVIVETLVSSHNDIVLVFFAVLSFYLAKNGFASSLSIIISILIKFASLFLVPVYVLQAIGKVSGERLYALSAISMLLVFSLSPLREELYPWYATWFIVFTSFLYKNKFILGLVTVFSFSLMLRYIPYMATGNYFGSTPIMRLILTALPLLLFLIYAVLKKKINFRI